VKETRIRGACESCRKRRKKCTHGVGSSPSSSTGQGSGQGSAIDDNVPVKIEDYDGSPNSSTDQNRVLYPHSTQIPVAGDHSGWRMGNGLSLSLPFAQRAPELVQQMGGVGGIQQVVGDLTTVFRTFELRQRVGWCTMRVTLGQKSDTNHT